MIQDIGRTMFACIIENSVDLDQQASDKASGSRSTQFSKSDI